MKKLSVIILSILCLTLSVIPSVYADEIQDISYTINSSNYAGFTFCDNSDNDKPNCDGYSYFVVNLSDPETTTSSIYFRYTINNLTNTNVYTGQYNELVYSLPNINITKVAYQSGIIHNYFNNFPNGSITMTLSASKNCPACPTCPDPNEPTIVRMFKDGFWAVATAFVSLIVPVLALFLVFRLVHDFFWGRG